MNVARLGLAMWVLAMTVAAPLGAQSEQVVSRDGISFVSAEAGAGSRERLKALAEQAGGGLSTAAGGSA